MRETSHFIQFMSRLDASQTDLSKIPRKCLLRQIDRVCLPSLCLRWRHIDFQMRLTTKATHLSLTDNLLFIFTPSMKTRGNFEPSEAMIPVDFCPFKMSSDPFRNVSWWSRVNAAIALVADRNFHTGKLLVRSNILSVARCISSNLFCLLSNRFCLEALESNCRRWIFYCFTPNSSLATYLEYPALLTSSLYFSIDLCSLYS